MFTGKSRKELRSEMCSDMRAALVGQNIDAMKASRKNDQHKAKGVERAQHPRLEHMLHV